MWVLTKSDWPVLVNLSRAATIGYQQIVKFDPRTRVIASAWEQEHVLAECATGEEAKALVLHISRALAADTVMLDLQGTDLAALFGRHGGRKNVGKARISRPAAKPPPPGRRF